MPEKISASSDKEFKYELISTIRVKSNSEKEEYEKFLKERGEDKDEWL